MTLTMQIPSPADFEKAARKSGKSISELCRRAKLNRHTYQNYKNGKNATIATIKALVAASNTLDDPAPPPEEGPVPVYRTVDNGSDQ